MIKKLLNLRREGYLLFFPAIFAILAIMWAGGTIAALEDMKKMSEGDPDFYPPPPKDPVHVFTKNDKGLIGDPDWSLSWKLQ